MEKLPRSKMQIPHEIVWKNKGLTGDTSPLAIRGLAATLVRDAIGPSLQKGNRHAAGKSERHQH
jgi:hypothetical protein